MDQGNHLKKVPFILVTGFLGSGKTSLLLDLVRKYSDRLRMAIVQNEFAPGHVDGFTLKQSNKPFELLEINNGSVFCACLLGDFITRLAPFIEQHRPDLILLEATGLADPVSLGQVLQAPELSDKIYLAGSWCLVDALNFHRIIGSISRARHQVRIADIVWINKTDLVSSTSEIRAKILELNPFARIIETTFGSTDQVDLTEALVIPAKAGTPSRYSEPFSVIPAKAGTPTQSSHLRESTSEGRPNLVSCVVRSTRFFHEEQVRGFVTEQSVLLHRIKGYIRINESDTMAIQTVFTDISISLITGYDGPSELIAIGPYLNNREFSKQLLSLQIR
ncbi:MAG: CobW family GTP-binding protein [Bacteroidia bacterium]|nr:CobW family GTP-binding protein [Bacteroidia bacterium]